jgi:hypothetical protein
VPLRIAVDFDSTIALSLHPNPGVGDLVPEADTYIRRLKDDGHEIVIWSARANKDENSKNHRELSMSSMKKFLKNLDIPFDWIDHGHEGKVLADLYVDDRGLGAPLTRYRGKDVINWPLAYQMIRLVNLSKKVIGHGRVYGSNH